MPAKLAPVHEPRRAVDGRWRWRLPGQALALGLGLGLATAGQATYLHAAAGVDGISSDDSNTTGQAVFAAVNLPGGTASASASLTSLGFAGSDSTHWAVGAPGAGARTDYYFGVEGAGEVVTLRFKFVTAGGWAWDDASSFTSSGAFSILLQSATGPAPYVTANLTLVQCLGCGGRLGGGSLTTTTDLYGPGVSTTVP